MGSTLAVVCCCILSRILWNRMGQLSAGVFCPGCSAYREASLKPLQLGRGRQGLCREPCPADPEPRSSQAAYPSWPFTKAPSFSLDILNRQPVGFKVFAPLDSIQEDCLASDLKRIPLPKWAPPTVLSSRPGFLQAGLSLDWDRRAEKVCWHSSSPKTHPSGKP